MSTVLVLSIFSIEDFQSLEHSVVAVPPEHRRNPFSPFTLPNVGDAIYPMKVLKLLKNFVALDLRDLHPSVARNPYFDVRRSLEPLEPLQISLHDEWSNF